MIEFLKQPWPWFVAGPLLGLLMLSLFYFGKSFGISRNLVTLCRIGGAHKISDFFNIDLKAQRWNLVFVLGSIMGGFIAIYFMTVSVAIDLSSSTVSTLKQYGIQSPGKDFLPNALFGPEALSSPLGIITLILGGFLVGFGTRYAGGCTSGHAISGLSNFQIPSLVAVIGFFVGGLIATYFFLPQLFSFLI